MLTHKCMCVKIDIRKGKKVGERWKESNKIMNRRTIGRPSMFYVQLGNSHKVYRKRVKRDG